MFVNNLILSQLDYYNAILANAINNDLKPLQKILHSFVHFIYNLNWNEHVTPYLIKMHFYPLNIAYYLNFSL